MWVSASTHRRTNSSGVSGSSVGDGAGDEEGVGGGGSAEDDDESLQPESDNDTRQHRTMNTRGTTSNPPEIRGDRRRDASGTSSPERASSRRLWTT
jgi:hypothetical protein